MAAGRPLGRVVLWSATFLAATTLGIAWALHSAKMRPDEVLRMLTLSPAAIALLALFSLGIYAADFLRFKAHSWALGVPMRWRAGIDAVVANFLFSWITPGAAFGAPAAIVMLTRHGVSWDAATLIAFGKSAGGAAVLLAVAALLMVCGLSPNAPAVLIMVLLPGISVVGGWLLVLVIGAAWPERTVAILKRGVDAVSRNRVLGGWFARRIVKPSTDFMVKIVVRLGVFGKQGARVYAVMLLSHLVYFAMFVSVAVVLADAVGGRAIGRIAGLSTIYLAGTYFAPTPGGAGLSEAAAQVFFGGVLEPRAAVALTLAFRIVTFYFQIVVGAVYMAVVGGIHEIAGWRAQNA